MDELNELRTELEGIRRAVCILAKAQARQTLAILDDQLPSGSRRHPREVIEERDYVRGLSEQAASASRTFSIVAA